MWFLVALLVVAPIGWALAGAPAVPGVLEWTEQQAPELARRATLNPIALGAAALVGAGLGAGRARMTTTHVSTLAHEFGHGLTAAMLGGRVRRIRTHRDGSGAAYTALPDGRPLSQLLVAAMGYLSPGVLALASMRVADAGLATLWVAYLVVGVAVMLVLVIRSWWAVLTTLGLAASGWAVVVFAPDAVVTVLVAGLAGVLAGGGTVDAWDQWRARRGPSGSDAATMAAQTGLPVGLFAGGHLLMASVLATATLTVPWWP